MGFRGVKILLFQAFLFLVALMVPPGLSIQTAVLGTIFNSQDSHGAEREIGQFPFDVWMEGLGEAMVMGDGRWKENVDWKSQLRDTMNSKFFHLCMR